MKAWGALYYSGLGLPLGVRHVVRCEYIKWSGPSKKKIDLYCELFKDDGIFDWGAISVRLYGTIKKLENDMVLVDAEFCRRYPAILVR